MMDNLKNTFEFKKENVDIVCMEKLLASAKTDTSGRWVSKTDLKEYTDRVISMCIVSAVNAVPKCSTSHDMDVAGYGIQCAVENIKRSFGRT
jgi:predicted transcriptional regulator